MKHKNYYKNITFCRIFFIRSGIMIALCLLLQAIGIKTYAQTATVTLIFKNSTIEQVINAIESQTPYHFLFNQEDINVSHKVSINVKKQNINDVLVQLFKGTDIDFQIEGKQIVLILKSKKTVSRTEGIHEITGKVIDAKGQPLPGVTVIIQGTTKGTITDANGYYSLGNVSSEQTLEFSFVGMQKSMALVGNRSVINVTMSEATTGLNEVVVVGYGTQIKKVMTGATVQVKGDDLQKLNTVSAMDALQGTTPGVSITKTDAQPGDGTKVYIRGIGTINNATPLYVVDGVVVSNIDYLSPSDIQSIDVLKDATAAIYGSRAANGVILVTTKQGRGKQKPSISYDGYYGVQNLYKKEQVLNAQQYLTIIQEARVNSGLLPFTNDYIIQNVPDGQSFLDGTNKGTNWLDAITNNNAPIQSHALNITGGNDMSIYSIGLSYVSQDGILGKPVASHYDRYNFRINSDHKLITNKERAILKIGETLNYDYSEKSGIAISDGFYNDISDCINACPFMPVYDESGNYSSVLLGWDSSGSNPIGLMVARGHNLQKTHNLIGNIYFEVQPIKNLIWRSVFSYNVYAGSYRSYAPAYDFGPRSISPYDITSQSMSVGLGWTWDNTVSYKYSVAKNNFSILAGTSAERDGLGESISGSNGGSIFNSFQYAYLINNPTIYNNGETTLTGSPWGKSGILSYFGRLNYDYNNTYLLQGIIRADGSSNFDIGHRWGTFPAFSAGWVMTNEPFMKNINWLDFLKIRGSWGKNGNQAISPFQYLTTISSGAKYFYGTDKVTPSIGAYPSIVPNPNVTWETSNQTDFGFDANLLSNRLTLTFDWYNKITKNWLVQAPLEEVYGTNAPYINGGDIDNRGYEIALGWRSEIGKLKYNINANIAFNHNRVIRIANSEGIIEGQYDFYGNNDTWYRAQVGYPIGYFYGYKTDGIFQTEADVQAYINSKTGKEIMPNAVPGDVKFVDLNGNGVIDSNDRTEIGDPHPHYTYGVTANLEYKGFDFSVVGVGVSGNQIVDAMDYSSIMDLYSNYTAAVLNRWHGPGTSNYYPRVVSGASINTQYFSDLYMKSGAYFRISNITLGYDFKQLLPMIPLQQIRFYVTIQNLHTFTKYPGMDPEVGYAPDGWSQGIDIGNYPSPRTIMIGASLKF
ncbi:TonB-dependent receptor [Microbacter margulisiae]|uniref:TonB-linked SusC/RagA family outer membrane protein n=1 Tax=Microbacter margulisiae TaxID=1350067 RepID=A0A7W5DT05_9PORP|nr:TonB-dependent receptor [Microbacter margulisiae]MBB3188530.1 TonB-linked SusC/RagA family outer membrane protein [Microbacter margulisiae]